MTHSLKISFVNTLLDLFFIFFLFGVSFFIFLTLEPTANFITKSLIYLVMAFFFICGLLPLSEITTDVKNIYYYLFVKASLKKINTNIVSRKIEVFIQPHLHKFPNRQEYKINIRDKDLNIILSYNQNDYGDILIDSDWLKDEVKRTLENTFGKKTAQHLYKANVSFYIKPNVLSKHEIFSNIALRK
jgi:hypothetical protein